MKRTLIIGGRNISINTLRNPIDIAFDRFYAAYLGQSPLLWDEIEGAAAEFFDRTVANWSMHDDYFDNFTVIWRPLLDGRRYEEAEHIWQHALQPALDWERAHHPRRIHKGSPYYY